MPEMDWTTVHPALRMAGQSNPEGLTMLIFGELGTWKTSFAATAPNPVFLSIGPEGGDDALGWIPNLYGSPQPPSFRVKCTTDMWQYVEWLSVNARANGFQTIVVDPINAYTDMWMSELLLGRKAASEKGRGRPEDVMLMRKQDWGGIEIHIIKEILPKLHRTGLNVIWIAHETKVMNPPMGQDGTPSVREIVPYLQGSVAKKLPNMVKMIIRATKSPAPDPAHPGRFKVSADFWTQPTSLDLIIRHKYGLAFDEGKLVPEPGQQQVSFYDVYKRIPWAVYTGQR